MDRGAWQVTVHGVVRVRHDLQTKQQHCKVALLMSEDPSDKVKVLLTRLCLFCDPMDYSPPGSSVHEIL